MAGPGLIPAGAVAGTNVVVDVAPLSATISAEINSKIYIYVKGIWRLFQILTVGSFTFDSFHGFFHCHPGTKGAYIDTNIGYSHWIVKQLILI